MRTSSKVLIAIGAVLAVLAGLWLLIAPGQLVKYPNDLDKTAVATGKFTLFVDPATGAPRSSPQVLPLTINRRLHVVSSDGSQAVVQEDDIEKIGPLPQQDLQQRYVISRTSMENLASNQSYAYAPANIVNRAPAYSINLPFDTGAGPYEIWKNEVGRSYTFRQTGDKVTSNGLTLIPLQGELTNVPAKPYYLDQLRALGLPTQTTIAKLAPQLKALGLDPAQLSATLLPKLTPADRAAVRNGPGPTNRPGVRRLGEDATARRTDDRRDRLPAQHQPDARSAPQLRGTWPTWRDPHQAAVPVSARGQDRRSSAGTARHEPADRQGVQPRLRPDPGIGGKHCLLYQGQGGRHRHGQDDHSTGATARRRPVGSCGPGPLLRRAARPRQGLAWWASRTRTVGAGNFAEAGST